MYDVSFRRAQSAIVKLTGDMLSCRRGLPKRRPACPKHALGDACQILVEAVRRLHWVWCESILEHPPFFVLARLRGAERKKRGSFGR
jgi:hypothetical protein